RYGSRDRVGTSTTTRRSRLSQAPRHHQTAIPVARLNRNRIPKKTQPAPSPKVSRKKTISLSPRRKVRKISAITGHLAQRRHSFLVSKRPQFNALLSLNRLRGINI